jgi:hypothetical protein
MTPVGFCPYASVMGHRLPAQPASLEHPGRLEPPEEPELVDELELPDLLEPEDEPELLLPAPEPLEDPELPDVPELLVELEPPVVPGFPPTPVPPQAGKPPTEPPSTPIRASEPTRDALPIVRMACTRAMAVPLLLGRTSARSRRNQSLPP